MLYQANNSISDISELMRVKRVTILVKIFCLFLIMFSYQGYSSELDDVVKAQKRFLENDADKESLKKQVDAINAKLKDRVIYQFYKVYEESKKSGVNIVDPTAKIEEINRARRSSGVWDINVGESYDNGHFIVITDYLAGIKDPAFVMSGYGLLSASGTIEDNEFASNGHFSNNCRYTISIGGDVKDYDCAQYFSGGLDKMVIQDMKVMLLKYVKEYRR